MTQPSPPRARAPRSSSAGSSLVRAPRRRRRLMSRRDPRLSPVYTSPICRQRKGWFSIEWRGSIAIGSPFGPGPPRCRRERGI